MTYHQLKELSHEHPILLYDGVCNLCDYFVKTVIKYDKKGLIKFCALQDQSGLNIRKEMSLGNDISTALGLHRGKIYSHSDALYMVIITLKGWWLLLKPLYILPKPFRDVVYNWVAKNRYRWFGIADQCLIPEPSVLSRFLK